MYKRACCLYSDYTALTTETPDITMIINFMLALPTETHDITMIIKFMLVLPTETHDITTIIKFTKICSIFNRFAKNLGPL